MNPYHPTDEDLARLAHAVAHPARVRLVRALARRGPTTVSELLHELPLAQATVSQHLATLREAGVVQATREGRSVRYALEIAALRRLSSLVAGIATTAKV